MPIRSALFLACMALVACQEKIADTPYLAALSEPEIVRAEHANAPPNARPGSCWGREVSPAVVETVTEQIIVQPAEVLDDGTVLSQAIYRTETQQRIVTERRETWFETPCPEIWTEEFTASLQRALQARGMFYGGITSQADSRTRAAIRRYQKTGGLDSAILSLESARRLGLIAVERE
ncbi:peptidoglycan-binding domain-containing protein [Shimia abyssi]|uniref:Putative peptidoglycan binding protein n=1 Tax=Shimia abyssi TaxID=1662395 RepID=A0A2P8FL18_9RHOB|nr:peptidoglycan-binding domain-containing protein [Shimia abyssi]PSL22365.1 putative peptidoglycan binding protein [Shimia abyssi]